MSAVQLDLALGEPHGLARATDPVSSRAAAPNVSRGQAITLAALARITEGTDEQIHEATHGGLRLASCIKRRLELERAGLVVRHVHGTARLTFTLTDEGRAVADRLKENP